MAKIIIVGYGRMGKEIERQAKELNMPVSAVVDSHEELKQLERNKLLDAGTIAIEFTGGAAAIENLQYLLRHDCPVVCGSTPWGPDSHAEVLNICRQRQGYLLFSSNYSVGVNIFWRVVRQTSRLLNNFTNYDLGIYEQHHDKKTDSPSGTAVSTAQIVLREVARKTRLLCGNPRDNLLAKKLEAGDANRPIAADELQISSQRLGHVYGLHQLLCDSAEDSITVTHKAHSRAGFARGALLAAQFLQQQRDNDKPGFFSMDDLMNYFLKH